MVLSSVVVRSCLALRGAQENVVGELRWNWFG
jgi:hypothetical protein